MFVQSHGVACAPEQRTAAAAAQDQDIVLHQEQDMALVLQQGAALAQNYDIVLVRTQGVAPVKNTTLLLFKIRLAYDAIGFHKLSDAT